MISRQNHDVAITANAFRVDPTLRKLLNLTLVPGVEVGIPLGVAAGGIAFEGNLTSPEAFANHVDSHIDEGLQSSRSLFEESERSPSDEPGIYLVDALRQVLAHSSFESAVERWRERINQIHEQLTEFEEDGNLNWERIPEELARDFLETTPRHVALRNAWRMNADGTATWIGFMRVDLRHISAWWLVGQTENDSS